jgi:uroporphyrinogen-III decarboxylase
MAIDRPEMFEALLDIIRRREKRNVELLLEAPVDLVMRRGYYQGVSFWSLAMCRRFFMPRFKEPTDMVHAGGHRVDLARVKAALDGKISVIGALNEPITLERGTPEDIRAEVFQAVRTLGAGGGLGLTPAEAIYNFTPRTSLETLIAAWKEVRDYPIAPR